jgi:hypothetical protein
MEKSIRRILKKISKKSSKKQEKETKLIAWFLFLVFPHYSYLYYTCFQVAV